MVTAPIPLTSLSEFPTRLRLLKKKKKKLWETVFLLEVRNKLSHRKYQILQSGLARLGALPQPTHVARGPSFGWRGEPPSLLRFVLRG